MPTQTSHPSVPVSFTLASHRERRNATPPAEDNAIFGAKENHPLRPLNIVHTESSLGWGGQELRILSEAQGMLERGHRPTIACAEGSRLYEAAREWKLPVVGLPIGERNLAGIRAMRRWLIRHPADIVNTHSSTDSWLVAAALLGKKARPPVIRTRHISAPVHCNWPTRWLYNRAVRFVVTTGNSIREQLIGDLNCDPARVASVPTGVDPGKFPPGDKRAARRALNLHPTAPLIGIVATLRSWKGHGKLLEALARLRNTSAQLVIVGDGPQADNIAKRVAALGLTGRVTLPGHQFPVLPWLQAMDIFTLPSLANEGVPQALGQAMMCGLPVVTTPVGSILDLVTHERTGLIVETGDIAALATALDRLLGDDTLRRRLGTSARDHAVRHYNLERMLDRMEAVYRLALSDTLYP